MSALPVSIKRSQYSLLSLILLATVVALLISTTISFFAVRRYQAIALECTQRVSRLKASEAALREKAEAEFFGVCGAPILSIDPRIPNYPPILLHIRNAKFHGQGGRFGYGMVGDEKRIFNVDLRLLRTLDSKDYYRLTYSTDTAALKKGVPADVDRRVLLFEYDGTPRLLVDTEETVFALAPNREACIQCAASAYDSELAAQRCEQWLSGEKSLAVRHASITW